MKEEMISLKTAKLAKEKGFDLHCREFTLAYYEDDSDTKPQKFMYVVQPSYKESNWYLAPTQALLQKWLREKHNIHIVCWWYDKEDKFYTELGKRGENTIKVQSGDVTKLHNSYEESLESGLQQALNLI